jgi:tetratricopeptide (TPR) repeat protein
MKKQSAAEVLEQGLHLFSEDRLEESLRRFDRAMESAIESGDSATWDRAFCNRCAVATELGLDEQDDTTRSELRQIVLRSAGAETSFLAAYNLARIYELEKNFERALFYARIARERCAGLPRRDWIASSRNQIANLLLAESAFEDACAEYEGALRLIPRTPSIARAQILDNLGYCRIIQGRHQEGFSLLYQSVRTLRSFQADRFLARPLLSLCYAHLDVARLRDALRHGRKALDLAMRFADHDSVKNAHYLLGEIYNQLGEEDLARGYFLRLQQRYYPEAPNVPELLLAVDVRMLINLKA